MLDKLKDIEARYRQLEADLGKPEVLADHVVFQKTAKAHAELAEIVSEFETYQSVLQELQDTEAMLQTEEDVDLLALAKEEQQSLSAQKEKLGDRLKLLLIPKDPRDEKNTIMEIRAGTGGEEASLFVADLFRMYSRYAERKGWQVELLDSHATELKGFKEIVFSIQGKHVFSHLKFEGGVHRVQRVPVTEASGRIHTSAVTVAVLPEAEDVDIQISREDLRIDVYRSSGPGGQSVNTTDSAVRITYIPTGLVVSCQDEKSQLKNKNKAMKILRSRLLDTMLAEQASERAEVRRTMVGSGDRSERIRTYNFPQNRMTDHRINLTLYQLDALVDGDLDRVVEELTIADQAERLEQLE